MKVAVISRGKPNQQYPLNGIFEFDQAKALAKQGIEVAFIAIDFRARSFKRKYGLFKYECDGVHVFEFSLPINVYRRALSILQRLLLIPFRAMLKSFGKPDVVHAHFYSIAAIATVIKKKYGIPLVVTEHSSKINKPASEISALDKKVAAKAYNRCNSLICVSKALADNILQTFNHDSSVIPDMVDNQIYSYGGKNKNLSPFVYVSVGNLVPIKAFDVLIEAFAKADDDAQLYIIGDGSEKTKIENQITKLGLEGKVKLFGRLNRLEINEIYQHGHVFVLPSQSETFGVSYVEAMYAGLPVIATRCGGPESFVDDSNGMLVAVNDVEGLADAMNAMRANYSAYDPVKISEESTKKFSPDVISGEIIEIYNKIKTL